MIDPSKRRRIEEALSRLLERTEHPRALVLTPNDQAEIAEAVERVRGQCLGPTEPVLTVALAGGTGVGKSTLINALAGKPIAEASEIRPTTRHIQVYHHRDDLLGAWADELADEVAFTAHDRPELRLKLLVDAPDLDSFVVQHRATTKALLKRSGLVLYVFSPERYLEERTWSVLRHEADFSASAAVLNKVDRIGSRDELDQITEDLRTRFGAMGLNGIRIFRLCARTHVTSAGNGSTGSPPLVDDMAALRAYIEQELEASEINRLLREQRLGVIANLRSVVERIAPADAAARLDEVARRVDARVELASANLVEALSGALSAIDAELSPIQTLRRHERFWGPFRLWLAIGDFLSFGLANLAGRMVGRPRSERTGLIERILTRGGGQAASDLLRNEAYGVQDLLYARGLPVETWREVSSQIDGPRLLGEAASELETRFDLDTAQLSAWQHGVIWAASTLGGILPAIFVLAGLFVMTRDIFSGRYQGLPLLWHLLAMMILFFIALQGVVGMVMPDRTHWSGQGAGAQVVHGLVSRTLSLWIDTYRVQLEADLADLRRPLEMLLVEVAEEEPPRRGPAREGSGDTSAVF